MHVLTDTSRCAGFDLLFGRRVPRKVLWENLNVNISCYNSVMPKGKCTRNVNNTVDLACRVRIHLGCEWNFYTLKHRQGLKGQFTAKTSFYCYLLTLMLF